VVDVLLITIYEGVYN